MTNIYCLSMHVTLKGDNLMKVGTKEWTVRSGEYLLVNPLQLSAPSEHQHWPMRGRSVMFFQPMLRSVRESLGLPKELGPLDFSAGPRPLAGQIAEALSLLTAALKPVRSFGSKEMVRHASHALLIALLKGHPNHLRDRWEAPRPTSTLDPRVQKAMEYMTHHYAKRIELEDLAKASGASPRQVVRLFREHLGTRPRDFLAKCRAERAMERLRTTRDTVDAIAQEVGLGEGRSLARLLRRTHDLRPSDLR